MLCTAVAHLIAWAMKRILLLASLLLPLSLFNSSVRGEEIVVSAAVSLTDALQEVAEAYHLKSQTHIVFNFGSSSELARQIDEGAPVDIFFSADVEKMDSLEKKGLIESGSLKKMLSNRLVIVALRDSGLAIRSPRDLLRPEIKRIALAEPSSVPAGIYARKYLLGEALWEELKHKVIPVLDVRAALASVESGNVDVGIVYRTDAAVSKTVRIAYEIPRERGPKIVYPVAVMKHSRKKQAARDFSSFVSSKKAKEIFQRYGFVVLE